MRLTTQLMQVASWLLVQRAVREGDMAATEACDDRYRVSAPPEPGPRHGGQTGRRPPCRWGWASLLDRSRLLYERVLHLDQRMYRDAVQAEPHPVPVADGAPARRLRRLTPAWVNIAAGC